MNESVEGGFDNLSIGLTRARCSDPEYYNSLYGLIGTLFQVCKILIRTPCSLVLLVRPAFSWWECPAT